MQQSKMMGLGGYFQSNKLAVFIWVENMALLPGTKMVHDFRKKNTKIKTKMYLQHR